MKVGGQRIISVPADLALGEAGNLDLGIGANHDLIFVVDLYAVIDPTPPTPPTTEPTETTEPTATSEPTATHRADGDERADGHPEPTDDVASRRRPSEPAATTEPTQTTELIPAPTVVGGAANAVGTELRLSIGCYSSTSSRSRPMSRTGAEWVSSPTAM